MSQTQPLKLTENVMLYNVFVDPSLVWNKSRLIGLMTPLLYVHFCKLNGFDMVDQEQCVRNIERFTKTTILPEAPVLHYYGQGVMSGSYSGYVGERLTQVLDTFDWPAYYERYNAVLSGMTQTIIEQKIAEQLDQMIIVGSRKYNYLQYYSDPALIADLKALNRDYIYIYNNNYVFIEPTKHDSTMISTNNAIREIETILVKHGYTTDVLKVKNLFKVHTYKYVRLISGVNPSLIDAINQLKRTYYNEK